MLHCVRSGIQLCRLTVTLKSGLVDSTVKAFTVKTAQLWRQCHHLLMQALGKPLNP